MKITLPISHLINKDNIKEFDSLGTEAYQFRRNDFTEKINSIDIRGKEIIFHDSVALLCHDFMDEFFTLNPSHFITSYFSQYSTNLAPACLFYDRKYVTPCIWKYDAKSEILSREEIKDIVRKKLVALKHFFNDLSIENSNRYALPAYTHICNPMFLTEVVNELNIGFCFDIAHAIVSYKTWYYMDYNTLEEFIFAHPLDKCTEVHISSPGDFIGNESMLDRHDAPTDFEWDILKDVLLNVKHPYIAIEYYGDMLILQDCYYKLSKILGRT